MYLNIINWLSYWFLVELYVRFRSFLYPFPSEDSDISFEVLFEAWLQLLCRRFFPHPSSVWIILDLRLTYSVLSPHFRHDVIPVLASYHHFQMGEVSYFHFHSLVLVGLLQIPRLVIRNYHRQEEEVSFVLEFVLGLLLGLGWYPDSPNLLEPVHRKQEKMW